MSEATAALTGDNGGAEAGAATQTAALAGDNAAWNAGFDPDTAAYVQNKGWQSPADILSSYRNLEKFAGGSKNLVELPGDNADEAALNNFYSRLGRPDSPDKYELKMPDGGDNDLAEWFKQTAHKNGLSAKQAQALFGEWNAMADSRMQQIEQATAQQAETEIADLKREWGKTYDAQIDAGRRAAAALGYNAEKLSALESKIGAAEMLRLFATVGSKMGEDTFEGGERTGGSFGVTPAVARQQIAELKMDQNFMKNYLEGNPDAVAKMKRLMESAYE